MRLLIAALLLSVVAVAQPVNPPPAILKGLPPGGVGGACTSQTTGYLAATGIIYTCPPATHLWTAIGGGAPIPALSPPYITLSGSTYGPVMPMTPPTGSFTWLNQNSSSVTTVNGALVLTVTPSSGTDHLTCYVTDLPAASADYTADIAVWGIAGNLGAAISDGTQVIVFYITTGGSAQFQKWSSATSVNGNYFSVPMVWPLPVLWVRFQQSGTSRSMFVSFDGVNWLPPNSGSVQTKHDFLTETKVGMCQETNVVFNPKIQILSLKITSP